jgi:site-specific DNA recombinase
VPQEADTVRLIYRLYLEQNMGLRLIARHLNEQGIATRKGGRWSVVSIRDILRNRTYVGTYYRFGIRVSGSHPALIPSETFNRVQQRLSSGPRARQYVKSPPFLLSGLAHCGYCGNRMVGVNRHQSWTRRRDGQRSHGHYRYYQCQSRTNQSVCQYHTRRADDLEAMIVAGLERQASFEGRQPRMSRYEPQAPEHSQLQGKLKAVERRFRRYLDQAVAGDITHWQLRAVHQQLSEQREALEHRLASLATEARQQAQEREQEERLTRALSRIGRWQSLGLAERRQLLQGAIERVVVYDDRVETRLRL